MSWEKVKLGEILVESKIESLNPSTNKRISVKLNVKGVKKRATKIEKEGATKYYKRKAGQFIYGKQNFHKGAFGIVPKELHDFESSSDLPAFDVDDEICSVEWVYNFFRQGNFYLSLEEFAKGVGSRRVQPKLLYTLEIPLPPRELQDSLLQKVRIKEEGYLAIKNEIKIQQNLITKLRQSILQEAVQGKLTADWRKANPNTESASVLIKRLKSAKKRLVAERKIRKEKILPPIEEDKKPYKLPKGWEWCRLGNLSLIKSGVTLGKKYKTDTTEYKYLRVANVQRGFLKLNEIKTISIPESDADKIQLKEKDLLIIEGNGDIKAIGRCAIWNNEIENCIHQNHIIRIRFDEKSIGEYVLNFINSPNCSKRIQELAITSTGLYTLSVGKISPLLLALPPLEEQKAIVSKVNQLMAHCDQLEEQIAKSKVQAEELMQAILREAFTPKEDKEDVLRELLPDIDKYAQVAMATLKIENELGRNYGKVEKQKTGFLLQAVKKQPIPYIFEKSNFGTFSWELSNDLDTNPYLRKVPTGQGDGYEVKASKQQKILTLLNAPENTSFVQAVDEIIQVYRMPLINAKTDQIELLNTICKSILDTQSIEIDTIYTYMEFWPIKQEGFATKAEKFSRPDTMKVLELILKLGWEASLLSSKPK